jgi:hypothetical protein
VIEELTTIEELAIEVLLRRELVAREAKIATEYIRYIFMLQMIIPTTANKKRYGTDRQQ